MSGTLFALLSAFLWAVASVLLAQGAKKLHVLPLNLVRCVVSTAFFWVLLPFFGGLHAFASITWQAWLLLTLSVVMLLVVGDTLFFRAMNLAGVSWAMPVAGANPLWSVLLAAAFLHEPLSWELLGGAVLVVAGIVLISRPTNTSRQMAAADRKARRTGILMALAASVIWAVGGVALKPATKDMSAVVANCYRQLAALLILLVACLRQGRLRDLRGLGRRSWLPLLFGCFIGTGVGSLLLVMAIQQAGAGRTSVLTATSPMLAIPFSMLWLHERPTRWTLAGTALTTLGIALVA